MFFRTQQVLVPNTDKFFWANCWRRTPSADASTTVATPFSSGAASGASSAASGSIGGDVAPVGRAMVRLFVAKGAK